MFWRLCILFSDSGRSSPGPGVFRGHSARHAIFAAGEIPTPEDTASILLGLGNPDLFDVTCWRSSSRGKIYNCPQSDYRRLRSSLFWDSGCSWRSLLQFFQRRTGDPPLSNSECADRRRVQARQCSGSLRGRAVPAVDLSMMATLSALVAISSQEGDCRILRSALHA